MQILMEKINFNINSPFLPVVLVMLSLFICFILCMLYYRFYHFDKNVCFPSCFQETGEKPGPGEWEKQMLKLADGHSQVRLTGNSFVLNDYNQAAYKKLKIGRAHV